MLILDWTDASGQTRFAVFDVVSTDTLESLMAITGKPVEEGADVSDHARPEHDRLTIEGYVSNKPLPTNPGVAQIMKLSKVDLRLEHPLSQKSRGLMPTPGGLTRAATGFVNNLLHPPPKSFSAWTASGGGGLAGAAGLGGAGGAAAFPDRAKAMYELLYAAQQGKARIHVTHPLRELKDMMIERLAVPRTTETGNGATFQIDLKHVRVVRTELAASPIPTELRGAGEKATGSKAAQESQGDAHGRLKSIAYGAIFEGGDGALDMAGKALGALGGGPL